MEPLNFKEWEVLGRMSSFIARTSRILPKTSTAWASDMRPIEPASDILRLSQNTVSSLPAMGDLILRSLVRLSVGSDIDHDYGNLGKYRLLVANESSSVENTLNETRLENLKQRFGSSLLQALKQEPFEAGMLGQADAIIRTALSQNSLATVTWLNDLFLDNFERPAVAADLLALVSRLPYETARPTGVTMAIAGLNHKNGAVQEAAIRAFENWANPESLRILENVHLQPKWLNDYLEDVKRDLKSACEALS